MTLEIRRFAYGDTTPAWQAGSTNQAGDIMIAFAFRDGSTTAPSLPSGWTDIRSDGANTCSARSCWKEAVADSDTLPAFTNANTVYVLTIRGADRRNPIGNTSTDGSQSATITLPALTFNHQNGEGSAFGFVGHRSTNHNLASSPGDLTHYGAYANATCQTGAWYEHDSNGVTGGTFAGGGTSSGQRAHVIEILMSRFKPIIY